MKGLKIIILTFLLIIFSATMQAQSPLKVSEKHGNVFKANGRFIDIYDLPSGGYMSLSASASGGGFAIGIVSFSKIKATYFAQVYDKNLNFLQEKQVNLKAQGKDLILEEVVKFGRDFYIFASFINEKTKKKYLFYTLFDHIDLTTEGEWMKVAEVKSSLEKDYTRPTFTIDVSDNQKYIVIFGNDSERIRKKKSKGLFARSRSAANDVSTHRFKFTFWVLDEKLKIVNYEEKHQLRIEESTDKFYVRDLTVDDQGSVYILGKNDITDQLTRQEVKKGKRASWVDIQKSAFILEKIYPDGTTVQTATPEGELFVDMDILFDKEGVINLVGLNGEQVYAKLVATGMSRLILDPNNLDILSTASAEIDEEVLENINDVQEAEQVMNKRQKKRVKKRETRMSDEEKAYAEAAKRAALNVSSIAYSGLDENGDAVLVLEEQHLQIVTSTYTDANGRTTTTTTYYYHYDDLLLVKFIEDDVVQNYYKKSFTSVNVPLQKSMDVTLGNGEVKIMTQGHIVRADMDLGNVKDYELKAFDRKDKVPGMKRKYFTYRKAIDENTILAPARFRSKAVWYKIEVD
jgi:hypothetical protein